MIDPSEIDQAEKDRRYAALLPQIEALLAGESDWIANLANTSAALRAEFGFWWVGFYLVRRPLGATPEDPGELVLGPFQGPVACTRIARGRGVCGKAWETGKTQLVPDVSRFPGHIACSPEARSEIVVPLLGAGARGEASVLGVLDIDSDRLGAFDAVDARYLERIAALITR